MGKSNRAKLFKANKQKENQDKFNSQAYLPIDITNTSVYNSSLEDFFLQNLTHCNKKGVLPPFRAAYFTKTLLLRMADSENKTIGSLLSTTPQLFSGEQKMRIERGLAISESVDKLSTEVSVIDLLAVSENYRKSGKGTLLLKEAESSLIARGSKLILGVIDPEDDYHSNGSLVKFYETHGFIINSSFPQYEGFDFIATKNQVNPQAKCFHKWIYKSKIFNR